MKDQTADPLQQYWNKRDFEATPEPRGRRTQARRELTFVVQKHHARRLHYDFRLELDGTLKSWAVPKGPSLDPGQKRMAVQVEDHPLDYASFEGTIPEGHYGAGEVIVWDTGTWTPVGDPRAGYEAGKLKFTLDGRKLRGGWTLVRMHGREGERQISWLLIKERDEAARPESEYRIVGAEPDSVLRGPSRKSVAKGRSRRAEPDAEPGQTGRRTTASRSAAQPDAEPPQAGRRTRASRSAAQPDAEPPQAGRRTRASRSAAEPDAEAPQPARRARASGSAADLDTKVSQARQGTSTSRSPAEPAALPQGAISAALPATLKPALATLVDAPPRQGRWIHEMKFDGYRLLARVDGGDVRLVTRNGHDWTHRLPALAAAVAALDVGSAWLDGELVAMGAHGAPDFQALQNAFDSARGLEALRYYLFDLPFHAGHDLRAVPLVERRRLLLGLLKDAKPPTVLFSEDFEAPPEELLAKACRLHLEGLIGKRADSPYASGRTSAWIKLKCSLRQEFVIGGFTDPQGSRAGLGSLLLGVFDDDGVLHYAGNVGTGFDTVSLGRLRAALERLERDASPFDERVPPAGVHWVEPELVAEVAFAQWTKDNRVRQAVFKGLRTDKPASAIRREMPASAGALARAAAADAGSAPTSHGSAKAAGRRPAATKPAGATGAAPLRVTNADRVIDPTSGVTKGELVAYFDRVADLLLPHLAQRPVSLMRAPAGVDGEKFFQKHAGANQMPAVRRLDPKYDPGHEPLLAIDDREGLLGAAQMNVVELHTWNATTLAIEKPDRMVFDLDPGEGVPWSDVAEGAELVHGLLEALGLRSFLKTSGGRGLHVVVPLTPRDDWATVKDFSQAIVNHLVAHAGERFVAKSGPRNRVGRIFVDYLRNGRGATTANAFSPRARPGMPVSLPLAWDELAELDSSVAATVRTPHARLEAANRAWAGYGAAAAQTLSQAMKALGFRKRATKAA
jgi:bifunctional non-homologous end joining protein LigD